MTNDGAKARRLSVALNALMKDHPARVSINALLAAAVMLARQERIDLDGLHIVLSGAWQLLDDAEMAAYEAAATQMAKAFGGSDRGVA